MSSTPSRRESSTTFSRDEIGVEELQTLKSRFAGGDLNEKEFVNLFREIVDASLSELQLTELFQKIDANSDGTVDWDELTNYMFLSNTDTSADYLNVDAGPSFETAQTASGKKESCKNRRQGGGRDKAESIRSSRLSDEAAATVIGRGAPNNHKEPITRIVKCHKPSNYLTISKDGCVKTWNPQTLAFQSTLSTGKNWLTDACVMRRSNRLAVTSMNRNISFYDLSNNQLIGEIKDFSNKQCIPLCVEYVEKPADDREALVVGDDTGGISIMTCSDKWLTCDGRSNHPGLSGNNLSASTGGQSSLSSAKGSARGFRPGTSSVFERHAFATSTRLKKHTDWVTRIRWVNDIRAVVTASLDSTISILDVDRMVMKFEYLKHKKEVFDLTWCASTRLIASCGMERDIHIWNPYSSQRAVGMLRGHTASVLHLASDDDNYQIISVSTDNTFKVWDIRNHRCLQTFVDKAKSTGGADHKISSIYYDAKKHCLLSGTTHVTKWPLKIPTMDDQKDTEDEVERPTCIAAYNSVFHQVVTAEVSSEAIVKTWSAETGEEICSFSNAHGQDQITAIAFDNPGRRLLTGSHAGDRLKMWNFSNGALVKQFLKAQESMEEEDNNCSEKKADSAVSSVGVRSQPGRKIREIASLPSSFSIAGESTDDTCNSNDSELPSPSKMVLHHGKKYPKPPAKKSTLSTSFQTQCSISEIEPQMHYSCSPRPSEQKKLGRHCSQNEVTCILDIERNLRVGMGDYVCQRHVCSVGWDQKLYIWTDKNDEHEAHPQRILPSDESTIPIAKSHTMDVLALVYIPPAYIVTAGLDGKIILWSLNSGEVVACIYESAGAIEALCYASKLELLLASGEQGELLCFNRSMVPPIHLSLRKANSHPAQSLKDKDLFPSLNDDVCVLAVDKTNMHLAVGDATGSIKLWEFAISDNYKGVRVDFCRRWQVGNGKLMSLAFVESTRCEELFILASSANGEVSLWTLCGARVGTFGRRQHWQLGNTSTYSSSSGMDEEEISSIGLRDRSRSRYVNCDAISSILHPLRGETKETFLLQEGMPKCGEVWVCLANHRARTIVGYAKKASDTENEADTGIEPENGDGVNKTAHPSVRYDSATRRHCSRMIKSINTGTRDKDVKSLAFLLNKLDEIVGDITDIITVAKVNRGEIVCWNGMAEDNDSRSLQPIELSEFGKNPGWMKHALLTQYIGRIFREEGKWFRVASIRVHVDENNNAEENAFKLIDTVGEEHDFQQLHLSISMARQQLEEANAARQMETDENGSTLPEIGGEQNSSKEDEIINVEEVRSKNRALPRLGERLRRPIGGILPKRSSLRARQDSSLDYRRIHRPTSVPKSIRAVLHKQRNPRSYTQSRMSTITP